MFYAHRSGGNEDEDSSNTLSSCGRALQVITEAIMSLHHEESDRVFPTLYLPIMEECHKRVFARWREFNPLLRSWWRHRNHTRRLDTYICALIKSRWQDLAARSSCAGRCLPRPAMHCHRCSCKASASTSQSVAHMRSADTGAISKSPIIPRARCGRLMWPSASTTLCNCTPQQQSCACLARSTHMR